MSKPVEKRSDWAILGIALVCLGVTMYDLPSGFAGAALRGYFLLMGACLLLRVFTLGAAPRLDNVLRTACFALSLAAAAVVLWRVVAAGVGHSLL